MTQASRLLAMGLGLWATCLSAHAGTVGNLPEPGILSLVGIAAVALVYFGTRKK